MTKKIIEGVIKEQLKNDMWRRKVDLRRCDISTPLFRSEGIWPNLPNLYYMYLCMGQAFRLEKLLPTSRMNLVSLWSAFLGFIQNQEQYNDINPIVHCWGCRGMVFKHGRLCWSILLAMSGGGAGGREAAEFTHVNLICKCVFIRLRMYEFVCMNLYIFICMWKTIWIRYLGLYI